MPFLKSYTHPADPRWRGPHHYGPIFLLPITFLIGLVWVLFIADQAYSKYLSDEYDVALAKYGRTQDWDDYPQYPPIRWSGKYADGVGYLFLRAGVALIPDLIHLPIHFTLIARNGLHPAFALTTTVIFFCLWLASALMNSFLFWFDGYYSFSYDLGDFNHWKNLYVAGFSIQYIVAALYLAYMGFAAKAVHVWRAKKRDGEAFQRGLERGLEMAGLELEGKDEEKWEDDYEYDRRGI